jgi:glucose/arabinose dehydrogenase
MPLRRMVVRGSSPRPARRRPGLGPAPFIAARLTALLLPVAACSGNGNATEPPPGTGAAPALRKVVDGLSFPVYLTAPAGDPRLFIVEKGGRVRIVKDGRLLPEPFLDISGEVSTGSEQGLLSLAFHPGYASNGRFFVDFTNREGVGNTRVIEYLVSSDPDRADPNPVRTVLAQDQPFQNHNGGLILFGPDGKLYVGLGDGGGGGDPRGNGQDKTTLLGKILRIDVDGGSPYAIPPDNPFVGDSAARGEIWAYGLRNPWRFSFDRQTRDFYVADVGQNEFEEVDAVAAGTGAGLNYGWNRMEGLHCFEPSQGCDRTGLTLPVVEYSHADGCSVTGGYVYRGSALPDLKGAYFYSDFCSGFVRSFRFSGGAATDAKSWPDLQPSGDHSVTSFGEDSSGELYILTSGGSVYEVVPKP